MGAVSALGPAPAPGRSRRLAGHLGAARQREHFLPVCAGLLPRYGWFYPVGGWDTATQIRGGEEQFLWPEQVSAPGIFLSSFAARDPCAIGGPGRGVAALQLGTGRTEGVSDVAVPFLPEPGCGYSPLPGHPRGPGSLHPCVLGLSAELCPVWPAGRKAAR